jgi:hypothetical protein
MARIRVLKSLLLLIGLLGLIDKSIGTYTDYGDSLREAINRPKLFVHTRIG